MKQRIVNWLLKYLLHVPVVTDIIVKTEKGIFIDGEKVTEVEFRQLREEAKAIRSMRIWQIMTHTLKKDAYERGFITASSMEHLNTSKITLYTIDIQNKILNIFDRPSA